jgi:hypothetical protein
MATTGEIESLRFRVCTVCTVRCNFQGREGKIRKAPFEHSDRLCTVSSVSKEVIRKGADYHVYCICDTGWMRTKSMGTENGEYNVE